jgi:hypothetical protein
MDFDNGKTDQGRDIDAGTENADSLSLAYTGLDDTGSRSNPRPEVRTTAL